jgi:hypothetical protein
MPCPWHAFFLYTTVPCTCTKNLVGTSLWISRSGHGWPNLHNHPGVASTTWQSSSVSSCLCIQHSAGMLVVLYLWHGLVMIYLLQWAPFPNEQYGSNNLEINLSSSSPNSYATALSHLSESSSPVHLSPAPVPIDPELYVHGSAGPFGHFVVRIIYLYIFPYLIFHLMTVRDRRWSYHTSYISRDGAVHMHDHAGQCKTSWWGTTDVYSTY